MQFDDWIWFFPILFMFHDFEEVLFMKTWVAKREGKLLEYFPKYAPTFLRHFNKVSQVGFAFAVAVIFVFVSIITITASVFDFYLIWLGFFIVYVLHLVVHLIQAIAVRGYVPALVTSILCLPVSCWILRSVLSATLYSAASVAIAGITAAIVVLAGVLGLHKLIEHFPCKE